MMTVGEAVAKRIYELLFKNGWSLYRLAKESCIPLSTLKNLYTSHTKSPTLAILFKISSAFKISINDFLSSNLFDEENLDFE